MAMVDFHSHVLPGMDDGARNVGVSLDMLRESGAQGVDVLFSTSHFYADEEDPASFLSRRAAAYEELTEAMARTGAAYPEIHLGAEILYFPGMSCADELKGLSMGDTGCLLIEPPMMRWTDMMLDEIEQTGANLGRIPVIAHIDRFMRMLGDDTLFERVRDRKMLIQVNASFFLRSDSLPLALKYLSEGRIHFMGSDCHNMDDRAPNMGMAANVILGAGERGAFSAFNERIYYFLGR